VTLFLAHLANDIGVCDCYATFSGFLLPIVASLCHKDAFLPAAAWYGMIICLSFFALCERKKRQRKKRKCCSAEGKEAPTA
jgi:hypothetical protein